jgi:diguanylate cyclase (GGDEF)-like protein
MTGLELGIYDEDGPVGTPSGESPFCVDSRTIGSAAPRCRQECTEFATRVMEGRKGRPVFFDCWLGQRVFAVRLDGAGEGRLALAGGKTFATREGFEKAIGILKKGGVKVQVTGRHRYRFIGKRRLDELISQVTEAAEQFFALSTSLSRYRLRLNRQEALIENASLLYQVNDMNALVDAFMRALQGLFGLDIISVHLFSVVEGDKDRHFVRGSKLNDIMDNPDLFLEKMNARTAGRLNGPNILDGREALDEVGIRADISPVSVIPVVVSGSVLGYVNVYGRVFSREDMDSLKAYVHQIATAIDNKRLRSGVLQKLNRMKAMSVLYSSAGALQNPDEIFRLLLDKSTELMNAERGSLMLIDKKTDELFIKYSKGLSSEILKTAAGSTGDGVAGFVVQSGSPVVVRDVATEVRPGLTGRPGYKTSSFVSIPLKIKGRVVGVVNLTDKVGGGEFGYDDLEFLLGLASHAGTALEKTAFDERTGELETLVISDELTGLLVWRQFNRRLAEELERSRRYSRKLTLMIMEPDGFEEYKTANGARAADEALRKLSALLVSALRSSDILSRYAGGRFVAAFPETPAESASKLAGRVIRRVEAARFPNAEMVDSVRLKLKTGTAEYPTDASEPRPLFEAAGRSMLHASDAGTKDDG